MIEKRILPEDFNFDVPSVEIIGVGSKGMDKQAMVKRASADAFADVIEGLEKKANRTYLHVITTGAQEQYGGNRNGDDFPETYEHVVFPYPENPKKASYDTDGGLMKYHDASYMDKKAAVYQEHQTEGVAPSGEIVAARYNEPMHRGELIIAVDTEKWAPRLQKKASGQNIYLSMGCTVPFDTCFPKGTLVRRDDGYVPIEQLQVGDKVYSYDGKLHAIVATAERQIQRKTRVHVTGLPLPIECTPEHPLLGVPGFIIRSCQGAVKHKNEIVKRRHTFLSGDNKCSTCNKQIELKHYWCEAQSLERYDYLVARIHTNANHATVGTDFAYLCGQYVGDGCLLHSRSGHNKDGALETEGITIAASGRDEDADIIDRIRMCVLNTTGKIATVRPYPDKNAYDVQVYDKLLAVRIHELCGAGSRAKKLSDQIFDWSAEEKAAFLAGYMDADGCVTTSSGHIRISTVNRGLALDTQQLCWSIGIKALVHVGSSEENLSKNAYGCNGPCYAVGMYYAKPVVQYSAKLSRLHGKIDWAKNRKSEILLAAGFAYLPVNGVETFDCSPVSVYNIEVDEDPSYYAEGVIVHNCRVCGRQAKTASEHCDHFKKTRCQYMDDGTQCTVINDKPGFYDISGVDVPADRIAFVLRKVASGEQVKEASLSALNARPARRVQLFTKAAATLAKLSKMEKRIEGLVEGDKLEDEKDDSDAKSNFILRVENFPAEEIIDVSNRKGLLLSPDMLFKILGKDLEDPEDKERLCSLDEDCCGDMSSMVRELEDDDNANERLMDGSFDQHLPVDVNLANIIEAFMPEFGMTNPAVGTRSIRITIIGNRKPSGHKKKASIGHDAEVALRRTYARYLVSFAQQNDDATCMNALRHIAGLSK